MRDRRKVRIARTNEGWIGYRGRNKVEVFDSLELAQDWKRNIVSPKQDYGWDVNPETGEPAGPDKMWVRSAMNGKLILQGDRVPYTSSPASETYWCS